MKFWTIEELQAYFEPMDDIGTAGDWVLLADDTVIHHDDYMWSVHGDDVSHFTLPSWVDESMIELAIHKISTDFTF